MRKCRYCVAFLSIFYFVFSVSSLSAELPKYLGSKSPYPYEGSVNVAAPKSYELAFVYYVGRHGSRNLSSAKYDISLLELMTIAEKEGQITDTGKALKADLEKLVAHEKDKYGLLTALGKSELLAIGTRTGENYKTLLQSGKPILAFATYEKRAQESRDNFLTGLQTNLKGRVIASFYPEKKDPYLRHYDISPKNIEYAANGPWKGIFAKYADNETIKKNSRRVLSQLFTDAIYERLAAGEFQLKDSKGKVSIKNPLTAASNLFELYIISPSLREDGMVFDFGKYFTDAELAMFESIMTTEEFFIQGPSLTTSGNVTNNIMAPLVKNMIVASDAALNARDIAGIFNFGHAETIIPLASFLEIQGANRQTDDPTEVSKLWSTSDISPMGANFQWVFYMKGEDVLVQMLHNEKAIPFPESIKPFEALYYRWSDVKAYYSMKVEGLGIKLDNSIEDDIRILSEKF
jgi:multiple inositol-polyphosphate phosphatase / 2,3-bisphosphoglycerate 3-phosphatase